MQGGNILADDFLKDLEDLSADEDDHLMHVTSNNK